jgi:hypothetical protein
VRPFLLRDSAGFEFVPELAPTPDELVLDNISMSTFVGTPLDIVLRDRGIDTFAIAVAMEWGSSRWRREPDRGLADRYAELVRRDEMQINMPACPIDRCTTS